MPEIKLPKSEEKLDIYDYGFDKMLNWSIASVKSPLIYDLIEERLSQLIQSGNTLAGLVPGLQEVEL